MTDILIDDFEIEDMSSLITLAGAIFLAVIAIIPTLMQQSISTAALAVLGNTSTLEHAPRLALRTAARLTAQAPAFVLYSGDLPTTVAMIASTQPRAAP